MRLDELENIYTKHGFGELFKRLKPYARGAIDISLQEADDSDIPIGASKFGGAPDLPNGWRWPKNKDGFLSFVAQINFAQVASFDAQNLLPKRGMLYLFYDCQRWVWGYDIAHKDGFSVLYLDGEDELARADTPKALEELVFAPTLLGFDESVNLPDLADSPIGENLIEKIDYRAFDAVLSECASQSANKILGYSDNIQGQMQLQCELVANGLYCGNESTYRVRA